MPSEHLGIYKKASATRFNWGPSRTIFDKLAAQQSHLAVTLWSSCEFNNMRHEMWFVGVAVVIVRIVLFCWSCVQCNSSKKAWSPKISTQTIAPVYFFSGRTVVLSHVKGDADAAWGCLATGEMKNNCMGNFCPVESQPSEKSLGNWVRYEKMIWNDCRHSKEGQWVWYEDIVTSP